MAEDTTTATATTPAPTRPAWLGGADGGPRPNVWEWTWKTKDGYSETWRTKGPETEGDMRKDIVRILGAMTQNAIASGAEDPELVCTAMKPIGHDDSPFDGRQPAGTKPADIFQFAKPAPQTAEEAANYGR